jgi:hypothetical protein
MPKIEIARVYEVKLLALRALQEIPTEGTREAAPASRPRACC